MISSTYTLASPHFSRLCFLLCFLQMSCVYEELPHKHATCILQTQYFPLWLRHKKTLVQVFSPTSKPLKCVIICFSPKKNTKKASLKIFSQKQSHFMVMFWSFFCVCWCCFKTFFDNTNTQFLMDHSWHWLSGGGDVPSSAQGGLGAIACNESNVSSSKKQVTTNWLMEDRLWRSLCWGSASTLHWKGVADNIRSFKQENVLTMSADTK